MNDEEKLAQERISHWGEAYLGSTQKSYELAGQFSEKGDSFTAYLYLFVAFNNLYCLLGRFDGQECCKIRIALGRISSGVIESFYNTTYREDINKLNDGTPEQ